MGFDQFLEYAASSTVEGGSGKFGARPCLSCGRQHYNLDGGGWCPQCDAQTPEDLAERQRVAARVGHLNAARLLRRLARDRGISEAFRAVLTEEAEILERRAS